MTDPIPFFKAINDGTPLPADLKLQRAPRVRAEYGRVIVTLSIFVTDAPGQSQDIELVLEKEYAEPLATEIARAAAKLG